MQALRIRDRVRSGRAVAHLVAHKVHVVDDAVLDVERRGHALHLAHLDGEAVVVLGARRRVRDDAQVLGGAVVGGDAGRLVPQHLPCRRADAPPVHAVHTGVVVDRDAALDVDGVGEHRDAAGRDDAHPVALEAVARKVERAIVNGVAVAVGGVGGGSQRQVVGGGAVEGVDRVLRVVGAARGHGVDAVAEAQARHGGRGRGPRERQAWRGRDPAVQVPGDHGEAGRRGRGPGEERRGAGGARGALRSRGCRRVAPNRAEDALRAAARRVVARRARGARRRRGLVRGGRCRSRGAGSARRAALGRVGAGRAHGAARAGAVEGRIRARRACRAGRATDGGVVAWRAGGAARAAWHRGAARPAGLARGGVDGRDLSGPVSRRARRARRRPVGARVLAGGALGTAALADAAAARRVGARVAGEAQAHGGVVDGKGAGEAAAGGRGVKGQLLHLHLVGAAHCAHRERQRVVLGG